MSSGRNSGAMGQGGNHVDNGANNEEERLLASVDASLHDQTEYEDDVIRQATLGLAPSLVTIEAAPDREIPSFPPLDSIAPSFSASAKASRNRSSFNPSDVTHIHTLLTKVRTEIQEQSGTNREDGGESREYLKLLLKEQMLLSFLSRAATFTREDLPVRPKEERSAERRRSERIRQCSGQVVSNRQDRISRQPRTPIMARKRMLLSGRQSDRQDRDAFDDDDSNMEDVSDDIIHHRQRLKQLRKERKLEREERRRRLLRAIGEDGSSDSSSEEAEFEGDIETEEESSVTQEQTPKEEAVESMDDGEAVSSATCPLCESSITVARDADLDATLSAHMHLCQRRSTRSRRSTRANSTNSSVQSVTPTTEESKTVRNVREKRGTKRKKLAKKTTRPRVNVAKVAEPLDDLQEVAYEDRVDDWIENGLSRMKDMKERDEADVPPGSQRYPGGLRIPAWMNNRLFGYQREALRWLWDLHRSGAGGVLGDEMGLGKTVQVSAYLGALALSRRISSVVIVAPATMLQHWLKELARWAPGLRRILIHQSGEEDGVSRTISPSLLRGLAAWVKRARTERLYEAIDEDDRKSTPEHAFCGTGFCVVTTYENFRRNGDIYCNHDWSYIVLDEAQKIRNPDADVTLMCKRIRTPHRIAMSGTPIQNDLRELWSLFDFVFPGRLGTLPAFEQEFADPIRKGGYSNASPMQVQMAYRCALMLKELIEPFLMRRQKSQVKEVSRLPGKTEHVLFCRLSSRQRSMYEAYLQSDQVAGVMRGSYQLLAAVTVLRKICNHPDLVCDPGQSSLDAFIKNGSAQNLLDDDDSDSAESVGDEETLMERSGKLEVLSKILPLWHSQGHRVLVFCQWRKMLNIIQRFMMMKGWKFGRLDGNTSVSSRQRLVDSFNRDETYFCMLCTTRTGGVGLNLTGADRIVLYDPDFNPQTDAQARERAYRFGQEREVTVYRLITAGTIEEKIYQRQIFKTALSNSVLQDPKQRRLFSQRDLKDLFTLKADTGSVRSGGDGLTETGAATRGAGVLDPTETVTSEESKDNEETLKKVLKSKGLAGIFDHDFVEQDSSQPKRESVREMEEHAKRVARNAVEALRRSNSSQENGVDHSRFGSSMASSSLLSNIRRRNSEIESINGDKDSYTALLSRVQDFVGRRRPTTEILLKEFADIPSSDVAIFRGLLKSVASIENGRWRLKK